VYLLGSSLGGVFAPLLARESGIKGIIVYGTPAAAPQSYPGRSERFFREFAEVDIPAAWSAVDAHVLSVYGEFDESAPGEHHSRIAAIVNTRRPGRATLREPPGLDHCWTRHETREKSLGNCGNGTKVSGVDAGQGDVGGYPRGRGSPEAGDEEGQAPMSRNSVDVRHNYLASMLLVRAGAAEPSRRSGRVTQAVWYR
jgi:hypothetical protein